MFVDCDPQTGGRVGRRVLAQDGRLFDENQDDGVVSVADTGAAAGTVATARYVAVDLALSIQA